MQQPPRLCPLSGGLIRMGQEQYQMYPHLAILLGPFVSFRSGVMFGTKISTSLRYRASVCDRISEHAVSILIQSLIHLPLVNNKYLIQDEPRYSIDLCPY
jgi:hypothetical protein